ncbi:50S ribosome-binding GTPase, partial [Candidatus Woesearchaeota archaeon]|nr:50S ribosome-binding GTPase [Candidatus Woesearchaeota archaeon]
MSLHSIPKVESADFYLDVAFRRGKEKAAKLPLRKNKDRLRRKIELETTRITAVSRALSKKLGQILETFPSFDQLPPFYLELVKCTIDYRALKKSLAAVNWAVNKINDFSSLYVRNIRRCRDEKILMKHKREFYGRVSSAVKQIKPQLANLEEARIIMRKFPIVKTSLPTIVIAGYPNVGKTTLLTELTGADPEIASYPFTTQRLMIGYCTVNEKKFQFIDTPGLLDRPLEKRNSIELQAVLALKHVATKIFFLIDASESCGYSKEKQLSLLREIKKMFTVPVSVIISKADITPQESLAEIKKKTGAYAVISS